MIKPDYIPFSQETFDAIEEMRKKLLANRGYKNTPEFRELAIAYVGEILGKEYGQYLDPIHAKMRMEK